MKNTKVGFPAHYHDNNEEICSLCGMAEAMTPFFSPEGMGLMILGRDKHDFGIWAEGVRLGLPQCRELMEQQKQAIQTLSNMEEE